MNNEQKIILHLSLIEGVGAVTLNKVLKNQEAHGSLESVYGYNKQDFIKYCLVTDAQAQALVNGLADTAQLERESVLIENHAIDIVTIRDSDYPDFLRHIVGPPPLLYQKGTPLKKEINGIAFVGARNATNYGRKFIESCVPALVHNGFSIVSGGARGADSMAHAAALDCGGKTIAVLGSGLLRLYPTENKKLFDNITTHGGTLLSAFPLTAQPLPQHFPARNRIIAGLSRGCVVVQAARKSGSLITAHYALENGRDVFAVPGAVGDPLSVGCNALIAQGARLITGPDDILLDWGIIAQKQPDTVRKAVKNSDARNASIATPAQQIAALCATACSTDELLESTQVPLQQLNQLLFELQIAGVVVQNAAGLWETKGARSSFS